MGSQIIGVDIASKNSVDNSVISSVCKKCMNTIEVKHFTSEDNEPQMTVFKRCPVCGVKFNRHIIIQ